MDPQLQLFRRQYLQLLEPDFLAWPPKQLLRDAGVQRWLFRRLFDTERIARLPPERYRWRVLKLLLAKIEQSIEDPEEDEISDDLMSHFSTLITEGVPSETAAVQQKAYVTFTTTASPTSDDAEEDSVILLERRNLISGSLTTGFRTWEAALHLGSYLLSPQAGDVVRGKSVLELGAGTGFLSILCATQLGASHVTTTDGDEGVVETLRENLFLNSLDDERKVLTSVLRWGQGLRGTWVEEDFEAWPYDVVLGADITYEKTAISALVGTLRLLFNMKPGLQVIISGAIRNPETFEVFRDACARSQFSVNEVQFDPKPIREQHTLFYATAVPLKILAITKGAE